MKRSIALLLIIAMALPLAASNKDAHEETTNTDSTDNRTRLEGRPVPLDADEDLIMTTLNQERFTSSASRRFEIVFFISLPVTLFISYTLLEFVARQHAGPNNPGGEVQAPHYFYMVSTSLLTSFFIAYDDARRYRAEAALNSDFAGLQFEMPVIGVRF